MMKLNPQLTLSLQVKENICSVTSKYYGPQISFKNEIALYKSCIFIVNAISANLYSNIKQFIIILITPYVLLCD